MNRFFKTLKQVFKKLLGLYLIVTVIIFIIIIMPQLIENINNAKEFFILIPIAILISLLISFFVITFFAGPFVTYYVMFKLGNNVVDSIEESEQRNIDNNIYYRDVPKDYNPAVASLILNKWFERKTDIIAMLLYLIKRSYLKKDGDEIVYTGKDTSNLSESERYLVECYSISNYNFDFEKWKILITQEAKDKGYVENRNEISVEDMKNKILRIAIIVVLSIILFSLFAQKIVATIMFSLLNMLLPFSIVVILIIVFRRSQINVKLTKKGIEEQEKLVKLRKFLSEFSLLEKSDEDAMILWEDYLIYSISLGVNTDIVEKSKIYKKMDYGTFSINQQLANELLQKLGEQTK